MQTTSQQLLVQLEQQIRVFSEQMEALRQANNQLKVALAETKAKLDKKQGTTQVWQEKYEALKAAQGINSNDSASRKRALHYIDTLISEVDACIAQLEIEN